MLVSTVGGVGNDWQLLGEISNGDRPKLIGWSI
jgi:hypothetical protein